MGYITSLAAWKRKRPNRSNEGRLPRGGLQHFYRFMELTVFANALIICLIRLAE
jgi:hypothetical protein